MLTFSQQSCFDHHLISACVRLADRQPPLFPLLKTPYKGPTLLKVFTRPHPFLLLSFPPSHSFRCIHATNDASTLSKASSEPKMPGLLTVSTRLSPAT